MTILPSAMATLRSDPALEKMRFALVPSLIKEKVCSLHTTWKRILPLISIDLQQFWSNYFYRVGLIKQALALSSAKADDNSVGLSEQEGAGDESNTKEFGDDIMAELGGSEEELAEVLAEAAAKGDDATGESC